MCVENHAISENCPPPPKKKVAKLLEQAQIHTKDTPFSDVESLFTLDEDYSPQALVVMAYSTSEEGSNSLGLDALNLDIQTIYTS